MIRLPHFLCGWYSVSTWLHTLPFYSQQCIFYFTTIVFWQVCFVQGSLRKDVSQIIYLTIGRLQLAIVITITYCKKYSPSIRCLCGHCTDNIVECSGHCHCQCSVVLCQVADVSEEQASADLQSIFSEGSLWGCVHWVTVTLDNVSK